MDCNDFYYGFNTNLSRKERKQITFEAFTIQSLSKHTKKTHYFDRSFVHMSFHFCIVHVLVSIELRLHAMP